MPESEKRPVEEGSDSDDEPIGKKLKVRVLRNGARGTLQGDVVWCGVGW
jgi:hypothetical protein